MNNPLHTVLLIYSAIIAVNIITSTVLWYVNKNILFFYLTLVWLFSGLNFFLQSLYLDQDIKMLLSFSTYVLVSLTLYRLTQILLGIVHREKYVYILPTLLISIGCIIGKNNYTLASMLAAAAIALPMMRAGWEARKKGNSRGFKVLAILLFLNALHFLDYPFLRGNELGAIFGFSFALLLTFSFSIFLPTFLLLEMTTHYTLRLESEVLQRTKVLAELDNRNKMLISILCHDLATPITSALLKIRKIQKDFTSPQEALGKIENSLKSISGTVEKVRYLQAVSLGKRTLLLQAIDPQSCIQDVIMDFAENLNIKKISVTIQDHRHKPECLLGDSQILRNQVISNVFSNAVKFSKENSEIVFRISSSKDNISIEIIDFGPGIPDAALKQIFSFTSPTSSPESLRNRGTGFGLPLAHSCTELMRGHLSVRSQYMDPQLKTPVGTNFQITLPKSLLAMPLTYSETPLF